MNRYFKNALMTIISLVAVVAHSQTIIKLDCKLNVIKIYSNGVIEKEITEEIFEVTQYETGEIFIIPAGDNFGSVSTVKKKNTIQIENYSNENKWDVSVIRSNEKNQVRTRILIDRNNGRIAYTHNFNNGQLFTDANGGCKKIDTKKRIF